MLLQSTLGNQKYESQKFDHAYNCLASLARMHKGLGPDPQRMERSGKQWNTLKSEHTLGVCSSLCNKNEPELLNNSVRIPNPPLILNLKPQSQKCELLRSESAVPIPRTTSSGTP